MATSFGISGSWREADPQASLLASFNRLSPLAYQSTAQAGGSTSSAAASVKASSQQSSSIATLPSRRARWRAAWAPECRRRPRPSATLGRPNARADGALEGLVRAEHGGIEGHHEVALYRAGLGDVIHAHVAADHGAGEEIDHQQQAVALVGEGVRGLMGSFSPHAR